MRGVGCDGPRKTEHHNPRADWCFLVEIHRILIDHAIAARRLARPNGPGLIGAMNAKIRILVALPKIHGAGTERIGGAAVHPNPALQPDHRFHEVRPAVEHFLGRIERDLGVRLIERSTRSIRVTEIGRDVFAQAGGLEAMEAMSVASRKATTTKRTQQMCGV